MTGIPSYSVTASENVQANTGINWDEGMSPAAVNNSARANMADERSQWNDAAWFQYGVGSKTVAAVYVSGTSFSLAGADATSYWHKGRRVRAVGASTGTIYGSISSSSFGSSTTTVNVAFDGGATLSNETLTISASTAPMTGGPMPSTPTFSAIAATSQSISSGVPTKVTLGTINTDTNGNFASGTFTPTLPGYYQINAVIRAADTVSITGFYIAIYKNGSEYARGTSTGTVSGIAGTISEVIYLNGTTDYIELYGFITGTSPSFNTASSAATSRFSGSFLHP